MSRITASELNKALQQWKMFGNINSIVDTVVRALEQAVTTIDALETDLRVCRSRVRGLMNDPDDYDY